MSTYSRYPRGVSGLTVNPRQAECFNRGRKVDHRLLDNDLEIFLYLVAGDVHDRWSVVIGARPRTKQNCFKPCTCMQRIQLGEVNQTRIAVLVFGRTSRVTFAIVEDTSLRICMGTIFAFVSASSHDFVSSSRRGSVSLAFISLSIAFHSFASSLLTSCDLSFGWPGSSAGPSTQGS